MVLPGFSESESDIGKDIPGISNQQSPYTRICDNQLP